jgi:hypothetical protein
MRKSSRRISLLLAAAPLGLLFIAAEPAAASETVAEFTGSSSRNTAEFEIEAPWLLDWRVTSDGAYELAVEVSLLEAGTSVHQGRVLMAKFPGNGARLFDQDGRFYFRVDSQFANWSLKVQELTEEEAALYSPRRRSLLD